MARIIPILFFLIITFSFGTAFAAKGDLAVRTEFGAFDDANYDHPFRATAVIEGRCRDVKIPKGDSREILWLYRVVDDSADKTKIRKIGVLYYNDQGQDVVCLDDLAVEPIVGKNITNEMISVVGWSTLGRDYGLDQEKIVIVESMDLLNDFFE